MTIKSIAHQSTLRHHTHTSIVATTIHHPNNHY
nr:MAG TPA_asm: hypothetical protein [Caudoviricetes sp.]